MVAPPAVELRDDLSSAGWDGAVSFLFQGDGQGVTGSRGWGEEIWSPIALFT